MSRTKFEFDDLPANSRSLIIATLGLEIASTNCKNIFDLARKRHQTVEEVWRSICRKTAQPVCPIPHRVLETEYNATPNNATATAAPSRASAAPVESAKPVPAKAASAKAGASKPLAANAGAPAPPATSASVASASRARSTQNWRAALAVGLITGTILGVGIAILGVTFQPSQTAAVRPTEVIRVGGAKSEETKSGFDPSSVPAPQGTIRRMDSISKTFSKQ